MNKFSFLLVLAGLLTACGSAPHKTQAMTSVPASINLQLKGMEGESLDLDADLSAGRSVVLVFWQTWCGSCRAEAPELAAAAKRYEERARFIGVVPGPDELVDDATVSATAADWGLPYSQVRDRDNSLTSGFKVEGTPTIVVIDAKREVRYRGHSLPDDWERLLK